jgi:hypothetical protein
MHRVVILVAVVGACAQQQSTQQPPPVDPGAIVGTWRFLPRDPTRTPPEEREVVELAADGGYAIRNRRGTQTGTYELDGAYLTIGADTDAWITTGIAASADRLLIDAVFPAAVGADGLVGTWAGAQSSPQATTEIEIELRGDGSARVSQSGSLEGEDAATWAMEEPFAVLTFDHPTRAKAFGAIPGVAIGEWMYERL